MIDRLLPSACCKYEKQRTATLYHFEMSVFPSVSDVCGCGDTSFILTNGKELNIVQAKYLAQ